MADIGTLRLLFLTANLLFWFIGGGLLGFIGWTLSSLPNTEGFMSGSFFILYVGLVIGLIIALDGLLGCIGGMFGSMILLKLYVGFSVFFGIVQITFVIVVYAQKDQIPTVLKSSWEQINDDAKYTIQKNLKCCGIQTYTEYGDDFGSFPDSCFRESEIFNTILSKQESTLYTTSCLSAMQTWLSDNMAIWIGILVGIGLIQVVSGMLSCQIFTRLHEKGQVKPLITKEKDDEESQNSMQNSNGDLNDLETTSDRNIDIDGASCITTPRHDHDTKKVVGVIAMVNLENEEYDEGDLKEQDTKFFSSDTNSQHHASENNLRENNELTSSFHNEEKSVTPDNKCDSTVEDTSDEKDFDRVGDGIPHDHDANKAVGVIAMVNLENEEYDEDNSKEQDTKVTSVDSNSEVHASENGELFSSFHNESNDETNANNGENTTDLQEIGQGKDCIPSDIQEKSNDKITRNIDDIDEERDRNHKQ